MTITIRIDAVRIGAGRRKTIAAKVKTLSDSIALLGLRSPITVLPADSDGLHALVTGRNRLEACRLLGHTEIAAEIEPDKLAAQLWEIAENFHRSDLTAAQRAILVGRWVRLTAAKIKRDQNDKVAQLGPKPPDGGRPVGGVRGAARALGIARTTAQRAVNIAEHLSKAALREADRLGLLNNQRALSDAASSVGVDQQVDALQRSARRIQKRKAERAQVKAVLAGTDVPRTPQEAFDRWFNSFDIVMKVQIRIWLLSKDAEAYFEEQEKLEQHRKAMH